MVGISLKVADINPSFFGKLEIRGCKDVLIWCMCMCLIVSRYWCPKYDKYIHLYENRNVIDGYEWLCPRQK